MAGSGATLLDLMQVQVAKQSTWGTAVTPPTGKLMGIQDVKIDPGLKAKVFHDRRGSLAPGHITALSEFMPSGKIKALGLYEDVAYLLDGLCGEATPSGAGPYTRNYAAPITAVPSPRIQTMYYGDGTNCYRLTGMLPSKLVFKGESGGPLTVDADVFGQLFDAGTLAALSDRAVNVGMGDHATVFVDTWGGTIGSTALTPSAWAFELTLDSKRKPDQYFGSLAADSYHEADGAEGWDGTLKLSLEFNAATKAQYDAMIAQSAVYQRQVRIKYTSGTSVMQFDFAGASEETPSYGEDHGGVLFFDAVLRGVYNTTLGNWFKAQSINTLSTLA